MINIKKTFILLSISLFMFISADTNSQSMGSMAEIVPDLEDMDQDLIDALSPLEEQVIREKNTAQRTMEEVDPVTIQTRIDSEMAIYTEEFRKLTPEQQEQLLERSIQLRLFDQLNQVQKESLLRQMRTETEGFGFNYKPQRKLIDTSFLRPFGYEIFTDSSSTYAPSDDVPVSPDYIIGPGDAIDLTLYGSMNKRFTEVVNLEGDIFFEDIGVTKVSGLTYATMKKLLEGLLTEKLIGTDGLIHLGEAREIRVFILGDVNNPGSHTVSALSSLTNALFLSGGVSSIGSMRNIQLKRNGETLATLDLYDLLLKGDARNDLRLMAGDIIFVPPAGKVATIVGDARRPGIYELLADDSLNSLIEIAGGLKSSADKSLTQIQRFNEEGSLSLKELNLNNNDSLMASMKDGDTVYIYSASDIYDDAIFISGYTKRPGFYPWTKGKTIGQLFTDHDDFLLPASDREFILIKRFVQESANFEFFQVTADDFLNKSSKNSDFILEPKDEIFIFTTNTSIPTFITNTNAPLPRVIAEEDPLDDAPLASEPIDYQLEEYRKYNRVDIIEPFIDLLEEQATASEPAKIVFIGGNVKFPAFYPVTKDMNIRNAIQAAGGLRDSTFTAEIELTKKVLDQDSKDYVYTRSSINTSEQFLERKIEPNDELYVKKLRLEERVVEIRGEVYFPGIYLISEGDDIKSLIERAGGLTDKAYLDGTIFTRAAVREKENVRIRQTQIMLQQALLSNAANIASRPGNEDGQVFTPGDVDAMSYLDQQLLAIQATGRLVINLEDIIHNKTDDVLLEAQDSLFIPRDDQSVSVMGEIYNPASHLFSQTLSLGNYVAKSGGVKPSADATDIYIIHADGSISRRDQSRFFRSEQYSLSSGDTIVVPVKIDTSTALRYAISDATAIIYQLSVAAAAVASF